MSLSRTFTYGENSAPQVLGLSNPLTTGDTSLPPTMYWLLNFYRVGVTVCKWLFQLVHDIHANATFDYILPLLVRMPDLFSVVQPSYRSSPKSSDLQKVASIYFVSESFSSIHPTISKRQRRTCLPS